MSVIKVTCYDTRPYFVEALNQFNADRAIEWRFLEDRLNVNTASLAYETQAACIFVNDQADRAALKVLNDLGVKLVVLRSAGHNNIDLEAAGQFGMKVARVPAYSPNAVAEYTVALYLSLNRKIHRAYGRTRELNFMLVGLVGTNVAGKTVAVIGAGKIGRLVAQIFRGFQANVIVYDPHPDEAWGKELGITFVDFREAIRTADIVTLHVPLTPQTHYMFNSETFSIMKPGAYLVNTSRGKLIDTTALLEMLKGGRLGGVALDVYEEEEGVFSEDLSEQGLKDDELARLLSFPNVLITAHQAFLTREALSEIARITTENIRRWQSGREFLEGTGLA